MLEILTSIIPLDLASTLSPVIFAIAVVLLANKSHSKARLIAFFSGSLIVGILVTLLGFNVGQTISMGDKGSSNSALANLIIGIVFIFFAIKSLISKERKVKIEENQQSRKIFKWFSIGLLVNATNFDALFLNFTAAKEVGGAGQLSLMAEILLLCLNLFFFTLPISLPIFLYLLFPIVANKILTKMNYYLLKYCKYIIAVMFFILGLVFLGRGFVFFQ